MMSGERRPPASGEPSPEAIVLPEFCGDPASARLLVRLRPPSPAGSLAEVLAVVDVRRVAVDGIEELWVLLGDDQASWGAALVALDTWVGEAGGEVVETRLVAGAADRIEDLGRPDDDLAGRFGLRLAGGTAFGSGSHPSTRLAARGLEYVATVGPFATVCDVGCGSGILAMIARRLGAHRIVALDIDVAAARLARRNVQGNDGMEGVTVVAGGADAVRGVFDLVVANLPAAVLLRCLDGLNARLAEEGWLLLAGFLTGQEVLIADRARRLGLVLEEWWRQEAWCAHLYRRFSTG